MSADLTSLRRQFAAVEADLMKAAAATLTSAAFEGRRNVISESRRVFDRPREWTVDKAWQVDKAKPADGARMVAVLRAKPQQAQVLQYQIDGGIRRKGDVGATRYDVPVGASTENTDQFGGIKKGSLKKIAKAAKSEKTKRLTLAGRRAAVRALRNTATTDKARVRAGLRLKPLKWVVKSGNEAGTFFGVIDGVRGYWERPGRSVAAPIRRKGVRSVEPRGNNKPKLLLAFSDQARYRKRLKFDETMERAQTARLTSASFGRELERIQSSRSTR